MAERFVGGDQDRRRRTARELPTDDVVGVLLDQHADIADLLEQLENSAGDQRRQSFSALVRLLQAHESTVWGLLEHAVLDPADAESRRQGTARILSLLTSMSSLDVDSLAFSDLSEELVVVVSSTLAAEQRAVVDPLERLPPEQRRRLGSEARARTQARTGSSS